MPTLLALVVVLAGTTVADAQYHCESCGDPPCYTEPCCDFDCCPCPPKMFLSFKALCMDRDRSNALLLNLDNGDSVFNASQLDPGWAPGADVTLNRWTTYGGFQARYMGVYNNSAHASTGGFAFSTFELGSGYFPDTYFSYEYSSIVNSAEANFYGSLGRLSLGGGFRWINLRDVLEYDISDPVQGNGTAKLEAINNLLGVQMAAHWVCLEGRRIRLEATGRLGAFENSAEADYKLNFIRLGDQDSEWAYVGEAGVDLIFQVSQRCALTVGVQGMWIDGLALAPEQFFMNAINLDGSMLLYGGSAGFERRW